MSRERNINFMRDERFQCSQGCPWFVGFRPRKHDSIPRAVQNLSRFIYNEAWMFIIFYLAPFDRGALAKRLNLSLKWVSSRSEDSPHFSLRVFLRQRVSLIPDRDWINRSGITGSNSYIGGFVRHRPDLVFANQQRISTIALPLETNKRKDQAMREEEIRD